MNFQNDELDSIEFVGLDDFEDDYDSDDETYLAERRNRNFSNHGDIVSSKGASKVLTTAALTTSTGSIDTSSSKRRSMERNVSSKSSSFQELCSPVTSILHRSSSCLSSPITEVCDYVTYSVSNMNIDSILQLERDAKDKTAVTSVTPTVTPPSVSPKSPSSVKPNEPECTTASHLLDPNDKQFKTKSNGKYTNISFTFSYKSLSYISILIKCLSLLVYVCICFCLYEQTRFFVQCRLNSATSYPKLVPNPLSPSLAV